MTFTDLTVTPVIAGLGIWDGFLHLIQSFLELIFIFTQMIHLPSYVLALFLFTLIIKLALQPLMNKQMRSTRTMQRLQPQIDEIKKKYPNNQNKQSELTMALYKEANASPFAGCLPMLIQLPILFALYRALWNYVPEFPEYFNFMWIDDLSQPDPTGFVLALIAAASTLLQQFISSGNRKDKTQRMMMIIMPIMFFFIVRSVQAALAFYWIFYNILGALVYLPFKIKWDREDKRIAAEEAARKQKEIEEKMIKRAIARQYGSGKNHKKHNQGKKQDKPIYEVSPDDQITDRSNPDQSVELHADTFVPERDIELPEEELTEEDEFAIWLEMKHIKIKRKKAKLHPYSAEEEIIEIPIFPNGKEGSMSQLRKQYENERNAQQAENLLDMFGVKGSRKKRARGRKEEATAEEQAQALEARLRRAKEKNSAMEQASDAAKEDEQSIIDAEVTEIENTQNNNQDNQDNQDNK